MSKSKAELRKEYKQAREVLSPNLLYQYSEAIVDLTLSHFQVGGKVCSLFLPIEKMKEINTYLMWEKIQSLDGLVAVPKVNDGKTGLKNVLLTDHKQLKMSQWGIPEPQFGKVIAAHKLDIVFVPLLCFDANGHRVGYGGGFYDRFLKKCRSGCLFIGLSAFDVLEEPIADILPTDIPLHACITPEKIYRF